MLGAATAGVLIGGFGTFWPAFIVDSLTFLVSFGLVLGIARDGRAADVAGAAREHALRSMLAGLGLIRRSRVLLGTLASISVTMLGLGAVNVLFVPLLANDLRVPATWFGAVDLAQTSSMVLVALLVPAIAARLRPTSIITIGLVAIAIDIALIAFVGHVLHVLLLLFVIGFFITPLQASVSTIVQTQVPDAWMGRVGASLSASIQTASVVSMAAAGIFGDLVGVRPAFLLSAGVVAVAALGSLWWFRGAATARRPIGAGSEGAEPAPIAQPAP